MHKFLRGFQKNECQFLAFFLRFNKQKLTTVEVFAKNSEIFSSVCSILSTKHTKTTIGDTKNENFEDMVDQGIEDLKKELRRWI